MTRALITPQRLADHVRKLGDEHPPLSLASVDRTVHDPRAVRERFGEVVEYMARVELEVERNVLELLLMLPGVDETNRVFYQEVWGPQEVQHGLILDQLQQDLGMAPAQPALDGVSARVRILGALAHLEPVQDVVRLLYYLTGAATERSATLAYSHMAEGLTAMGEHAVARSVIAPIKRQEPGHFAFYTLSATSMLQHGVLRPWQLHLARFLRARSYGIVGAHTPDQVADAGGVIVGIGLGDRVEEYARDVGRVETELLWAHRRGLDVPGYVVAALRDSVDAFRERALTSAPAGSPVPAPA